MCHLWDTGGHLEDDSSPEITCTDSSAPQQTQPSVTLHADNFSRREWRESGMAQKQRSDADRRVRQCERLGRLLRLLHLIMGKGRWDAGTLAEELECSRRTVYRLLQTLSMAGVPWYFDETTRCYRVRPGYRFTGLDGVSSQSAGLESPPHQQREVVAKLIQDGEAIVSRLQQMLDHLRRLGE